MNVCLKKKSLYKKKSIQIKAKIGGKKEHRIGDINR